jgi:hypothetical protein
MYPLGLHLGAKAPLAQLGGDQLGGLVLTRRTGRPVKRRKTLDYSRQLCGFLAGLSGCRHDPAICPLTAPPNPRLKQNNTELPSSGNLWPGSGMSAEVEY